MTEYLVIGGSGQTGRELMARLKFRGKSVAGTFLSRSFAGGMPMDLKDPKSVDSIIKVIKPRVIFVPAAETGVDACENDPKLAMDVNAVGPGLVAQAAAQIKALVVLFSTDYVFDGTAGPYAEDAAPNPINIYGRSKLEGEKAVAASGARHAILRTCVVYSWFPRHNNFFMGVYDKLRKGEQVTPFVDQFVNPTYAPMLAEAALEIAERDITGLRHIGGADWVSRLDFCNQLAEWFNFDKALLQPVETAKVALPARRPLKAGLKVDWAKKELRAKITGLDQAFADIAAQVTKSSTRIF